MTTTGIISSEFHADIAAVQADPIAIAMAAEVPAEMDLRSGLFFLAAMEEYQRRGGIHGTTHMGAVAAAIRNLRG